MILKNNAEFLLVQQLGNFFGELNKSEIAEISRIHPLVLNQLDYCFSFVSNKYYHANGESLFNSLHNAQYSMYLYRMANLIKKEYNDVDLCDKIYGLSKIVSSADLYYEVELPKIWFCDHPQGAVLGRADYADYFSFSQGCTVGNNKGRYPRFGEYVTMFSNSKILGDCNVGDHVIMSANSYILDTNIPPFSIVFGSSPYPVIHRITEDKFEELTTSIFYHTKSSKQLEINK